MSSNPENTVDSGSSTDQYVTGTEETGDFITDKPPTATTPATGSSNAGINASKANHPDFDREDPDQLR